MPPVGVAEGSSLGVSENKGFGAVGWVGDHVRGESVTEKTRNHDGPTLPGLGLPEMHLTFHFGDGFTNVDL